MNEERIDGRLLRSQRTRTAIVDAVVSLLEEGDLKPTAPTIAKRADVALRTVFQHFEDLERLFSAVVEHQTDRFAALLEPIPSDLPVEERITRFVRQRGRYLEAVSPLGRATVAHETVSPRVREEADRIRKRGHRQVTATFAPELAAVPEDRRDTVMAALTNVVTWRSWESLRSEQGLSYKAAEETLRFLISAVLPQVSLR